LDLTWHRRPRRDTRHASVWCRRFRYSGRMGTGTTVPPPTNGDKDLKVGLLEIGTLVPVPIQDQVTKRITQVVDDSIRRFHLRSSSSIHRMLPPLKMGNERQGARDLTPVPAMRFTFPPRVAVDSPRRVSRYPFRTSRSTMAKMAPIETSRPIRSSRSLRIVIP